MTTDNENAIILLILKIVHSQKNEIMKPFKIDTQILTGAAIMGTYCTIFLVADVVFNVPQEKLRICYLFFIISSLVLFSINFFLECFANSKKRLKKLAKICANEKAADKKRIAAIKEILKSEEVPKEILVNLLKVTKGSPWNKKVMEKLLSQEELWKDGDE